MYQQPRNADVATDIIHMTTCLNIVNNAEFTEYTVTCKVNIDLNTAAVINQVRKYLVCFRVNTVSTSPALNGWIDITPPPYLLTYSMEQGPS